MPSDYVLKLANAVLAYGKTVNRTKGIDADLLQRSATEPEHVLQVANYLDWYGYIKPGAVAAPAIVDALKKFQGRFGLKKSGTADATTLRAMYAPRCGLPDVEQPDNPLQRVRAWAKAKLSAWNKRGLKFAVTGYLAGLARQVQDATFNNAFQSWCQHGNMDVSQVASGEADILISAGAGPSNNFDGPMGVLAWAYLPTGSDQQLTCMFDAAETWVTTPAQRGILLLNVAAHEFGHLMGLEHSRVQSALMWASYNANIANPQRADDIPRFQARYGERTTPVPPPNGGTPPPTSKPVVRLTTEGSVDVYVNGTKV